MRIRSVATGNLPPGGTISVSAGISSGGGSASDSGTELDSLRAGVPIELDLLDRFPLYEVPTENPYSIRLGIAVANSTATNPAQDVTLAVFVPTSTIGVNASSSIALAINDSYLDPSRYTIEFFGNVSLRRFALLLDTNESVSLPDDAAVRE